MTSTRRRTGVAPARSLVALAALLAAVGPLSGCHGHGSSSSRTAPPSSSTSPAAAAPLQLRTGVTRVVGELAPQARKQLAARAGALVEAYFRAAFLGNGADATHPLAAFPGFTPGAIALAARDKDVLTGAGFAGADQVTAKSGTAYVNVLAPHGHPVGATVRVTLALDVTSNGRSGPVAVAGRLLLTPTAHGWRIFGYDLSQSGRRARSTE